MKASRLFAIFGFIVFIGGGVQFFIMLRGAEGFSNLEGDLPSQVIYLFVYIISFTALLLSKHRVSFGIIHAFWFWLLLALTGLSFLWSSAPDVTIRQTIAIFGTTLFSIYLVHNFEIQEYVELLAISLLITVLSSYLVIFLLPNLGVSHIVDSEWRGIFTHKNHLGAAASLSVLIFFYLLLSTKKGRWIWLFGLISSEGQCF
jgi:exopolysaccharide production protein ExoQ